MATTINDTAATILMSPTDLARIVNEARRHEALAIALRGLAEYHERHATDGQIAERILGNVDGNINQALSQISTWETSVQDMFRTLRQAIRSASQPA